MKEHTFKIDGIEYTIDLEKAKSLGLLKTTGITEFRTGDVYEFRTGDVYELTTSGNKVVIIPCGYSSCYGDEPTWTFAGLYNTLDVYSSFGKKGATKKEMLEWLNSKMPNIRFIKNINDEFSKLLKNIDSKGK